MKEILYEDIEKVNSTIRTTDIKGKEYAEVNQRIKAFRMLYPQGTIETQMLSNENGVCVFKAYVYIPEYEETAKTTDIKLVEHHRLIATGTAYEKEGSTFINKTSYIENCETSAIGRALGIAGFGIDTSVASYEEVSNAMANQEEEKASEKQIEYIKKLVPEENMSSLLEYYKIEKLEDISKKDATELIGRKTKEA